MSILHPLILRHAIVNSNYNGMKLGEVGRKSTLADEVHKYNWFKSG